MSLCNLKSREKRMKKNELSLRDLWIPASISKYALVMGVQKGEEKEKIFKQVMVENFSNLMKNIN